MVQLGTAMFWGGIIDTWESLTREKKFDLMYTCAMQKQYATLAQLLNDTIFNRIDYNILADLAIQADDGFLLKMMLKKPVPYDDIESWFSKARHANSWKCIEEINNIHGVLFNEHRSRRQF